MFCPQCGAQLPDGTKFCGSCGFNLSSSQSQAHSTSGSAFAQAAGTVPPQQPVQMAQQPVSNPQYAQPRYAQEAAPANPQFGAGAPSNPYGQQYAQASYSQPQGGQQQYGTYAAPQGAPYGQTQPTSTGFDLNSILAAVVWPKGMPPATELFQAHNANITQYAESQGLGMKFYKFITWRGWPSLLVVGCIFETIAVLLFGGEQAAFLYQVYPGLRVVNILNIIWLFIDAAFVIYTRMLLAQYKRGATETMLVASVVSVCMDALLRFLTSAVQGSSIAESLSTAIVPGILSVFISYLIYKKYFGKRNFLFVN